MPPSIRSFRRRENSFLERRFCVRLQWSIQMTHNGRSGTSSSGVRSLRRDPEGMPKSKTFEDLSLEPYQDDRELWRWLYQQLRMAILDGRLRAGTRLPSTRDFADQYGVSRGTVVAAFDQLQAEGYTSVEPGSGTYVESDL